MEVLDVATCVGFLVITNILISVLIYTVRSFIIYINSMLTTDLVSAYGTWAVVTGCTDGIGLAYTRELARRGFSLVLISRSKDKLQAVASDLEHQFGVSTHIVQADFSKEGRELYQRIKLHLQNLDIGLLVNNVGVLVPYPMKLEEMSEQLIWDHLSCNVIAASMMTSLVLNGMKQRRRGAIINISSIAALNPLPYMSMYSASKAYLEFLSRGIRAECKGSGVTVQTLVPAFINTKMVNFSKTLTAGGIMVPSADTYVKHAVASIGLSDFTTGYIPHGIEYWFLSMIPDWIYIPGASELNKFFRREHDMKQD